MTMEMIQTTKASLPVVPAMPPMEKSTSGGTPAATQNAPFQSSARMSLFCEPADTPALVISVIADVPQLNQSGLLSEPLPRGAPPGVIGLSDETSPARFRRSLSL